MSLTDRRLPNCSPTSNQDCRSHGNRLASGLAMPWVGFAAGLRAICRCFLRQCMLLAEARGTYSLHVNRHRLSVKQNQSIDAIPSTFHIVMAR